MRLGGFLSVCAVAFGLALPASAVPLRVDFTMTWMSPFGTSVEGGIRFGGLDTEPVATLPGGYQSATTVDYFPFLADRLTADPNSARAVLDQPFVGGTADFKIAPDGTVLAFRILLDPFAGHILFPASNGFLAEAGIVSDLGFVPATADSGSFWVTESLVQPGPFGISLGNPDSYSVVSNHSFSGTYTLRTDFLGGPGPGPIVPSTVPLPAAAWLLLAGLGTLAGLRARAVPSGGFNRLLSRRDSAERARCA